MSEPGSLEREVEEARIQLGTPPSVPLATAIRALQERNVAGLAKVERGKHRATVLTWDEGAIVIRFDQLGSYVPDYFRSHHHASQVAAAWCDLEEEP